MPSSKTVDMTVFSWYDSSFETIVNKHKNKSKDFSCVIITFGKLCMWVYVNIIAIYDFLNIKSCDRKQNLS